MQVEQPFSIKIYQVNVKKKININCHPILGTSTAPGPMPSIEENPVGSGTCY